MPRANPSLTPVEFEAARALLPNFDSKRLDAARLVLVNGMSSASVAEKYDVTRQAMASTVKVVVRAFEKYKEAQHAEAASTILIPAGWEQVTLIAPAYLIESFRRQIADVQRQAIPVPAIPTSPTKKKSPGTKRPRA